jgi:hypothetical protein
VEIENVKRALSRACGHPKCIGREAILDTAERLIPEPAAWMVKNDGDQIVVYAIVCRSVHEVRGECKPADEPLDESETAECDYKMMRLTGEAAFTCKIARTEGPNSPPKTRMSWRFKLNREGQIEFTSEHDDEERERTDGFARALVEGISRLGRRARSADVGPG